MFLFIVEINNISFGKFKIYQMPFPMNKNLKQVEASEQGFSTSALLTFWAK